MKRVQINSRTASTNVLLTYPTLEANKNYTLTVEKLTVPALDSIVLNKPLFAVERRLVAGMRDVDSHPDLVHPRDHGDAKVAQAAIASLGRTVPEEVAAVIGQLRDALPSP